MWKHQMIAWLHMDPYRLFQYFHITFFATIPIVKSMTTNVPNCPPATACNIRLSGTSGRVWPMLLKYIINSTPNDKKSKLAGTKANPYVHISFCASCKVLHVRFFCIMSWSSPVITITMKIPLGTVSKSSVSKPGHQIQKIREWLSLAIV